MLIRETITIHAPVEKVWHAFVDLTCWADWNTVLRDVPQHHKTLIEGSTFTCAIRPYAFPIHFEPTVTTMVTHEKIVWTASKFGISSVHEFAFERHGTSTKVHSHEKLSGLGAVLSGLQFPLWKLKDLTHRFLADLKERAELL